MDLRKVSNKIPKEVIAWAEKNTNNKHYSFCGWLIKYHGELVQRYFAARRYKTGVKLTEVRRDTTGKARAIVKNLLLSQLFGYIPVFEKENKYSRSGGYACEIFSAEDFDVWNEEVFPCCFGYVPINPEVIFELEEFKWCGYSSGDPIIWARKYRKNPDIEMFGKMGVPTSSLFMKKAKKDKAFRKFIASYSEECWLYGPQAVIYAYNNNVSIEEARRITHNERMAAKVIPGLAGTKLNRMKIIDYCDKNNVDYGSYSDYLKAIKQLKFDLSDTKNVYPRDFKMMHDVRTRQYQAQVDKSLKEKFETTVVKFKKFEYADKEFTLTLPSSPQDLKKEGSALEHCVGRMGYDKKMADGKSVIFFCRKREEPNKPYVTVELDAKRKLILQQHGQHNSKPSQEVEIFLEKWMDFIKQARVNK